MSLITLPIPASQLHYADPALNDEAQTLHIPVFIDKIHYPTLGCPALLEAKDELSVVLSLPPGQGPDEVALALVDRHGGGGDKALQKKSTTRLQDGPEGKQGKRSLWLVTCSLADQATRLFDLRATHAVWSETQNNAVRVFENITGDEQVILCGDSQFNLENAVCLERFVDRVNAVKDIAWIALIGDVCDNGVIGVANLLKLAAFAANGPVTHYYEQEYPRALSLLSKLNKPVVLVPGNHDGMAAYGEYKRGKESTTYLGPDRKENEVAYDGHHSYRRTFGPLYYRFDWHDTRYFCLNTFELDRADRLGYHAIVANWGGHVREEQADWLASELGMAKGKHKVALMHHDPRGGAEGKALGYYSDYRPYEMNRTKSIVLAYMRYVAAMRIVGWNRTTWQQEWMKRPGEDLANHPVKKLLSLLTSHRVSAVIMGHDNENWVDSYFPGDDIFEPKEARVDYPGALPAAEQQVIVNGLTELLRTGEMEQATKLLSDFAPQEREDLLEWALRALEDDGVFEATEDYASPAAGWNLVVKGPLHFVHVDDVGAYKHSRDAHFEAYGYVLAQLHQGRPVKLRRVSLKDGHERGEVSLDMG